MPPKLPAELEAIIFEELADDFQTLATCALVAKRWLHHSRELRFLNEHVALSLVTNSARERHFIDLICDRTCSFHSHILDVRISDPYSLRFGDSDEEGTMKNYEGLFTISIARFAYLRKLELSGFSWSALTPATTSIILSISGLESIAFSNAVFPNYAKLMDILRTPQWNLQECSLCDIAFEEEENSPATEFPPLSPDLKIHVGVNFAKSAHQTTRDVAGFLFKHISHVHSFFLEQLDTTSEEYLLERELVHRFAHSLTDIRLAIPNFYWANTETYENNPISFSRCIHLRSLNIGSIAPSPLVDARREDLRWLCAALQSIPSGRRFQKFSVAIYDDEIANEFLEDYDWKSIEEVLIDKELFPSEPLVTVEIQSAYSPALEAEQASSMVRGELKRIKQLKVLWKA